MIQVALLVTALCLDSFVASVAYGADGIKIPLRSAVVISAVGSIVLGLSFFAAFLIRDLVSQQICIMISFLILLLIGINNLFQNLIKSFLKIRNKKLNFKVSGIRFMIDIYLDETKADIDHSKVLSMKEALFFAIAVSIDSLVTGLGSGLIISNQFNIVLFSFVINMFAIGLGFWIGRKCKSKFDISWLGGAMFIVLAFLRIL